MRTEEMYHRQQEVYLFDLLEPDQERLYVGRKEPRSVPGYAITFPDHLIKNSPEQITDKQREEREDDFLRLNGVK